MSCREKQSAFARSGLSPMARLQPRNSAIPKQRDAVHTIKTKAKSIVRMKPSRLYPWRLRAALTVIVTGVLALFASINANPQIQWIDADVGGPTFKGSSVKNADGTYTIQGGGSDIWNTSSQFHYLYAWASGKSWEITAQFQSFSGPDTWSKVELLASVSDPTAGPQGGDPFIAMMDTQPSTVTPPD